MILKLKAWCEGIVIAIIISTIIEMIIPDNKSKKYVKVVIGIYIMFVCLNPILELLKYDLNFENIFDIETVEASTSVDSKIKDVYVLGIEEKIKEDVESIGYILEDVQVFVDSNYEEINGINLKIKSKQSENIVEIEKINIGKQTDEKENYEDIVNLLVTNYLVSKDKIFIEV
jgi:stage III sporulation protein AF